MSQNFPIPRQDDPRDGQPDGDRDNQPVSPDGPGRDPDTLPGGPADAPGIVEWGRPAASRSRRTGRALAGLGQDARVVPVVAGLGAVAAFASLVGEWTITTVPDGNPETNMPMRMAGGVAEMPTFGAVYVVGLLGLVGCLALVFFGAPTIRHNARVLGVAAAGALLAVLVAATLSLDTLFDGWGYGQPNGPQVERGRGLIMAYAAIVALGLALLLAGRFIRPVAPPAADAARAAEPASAGDSDWPWRRPRPAAGPDPDDGPGTPIDLTVAPTTPFIRSEQQHPR